MGIEKGDLHKYGEQGQVVKAVMGQYEQKGIQGQGKVIVSQIIPPQCGTAVVRPPASTPPKK